MALIPRYCSQCGQPVGRQTVQGRPRAVCSACGTVFYENPLPVAAAVVLNERRQVLLIRRKRDPYQGQWCLPMGFAEVGETIADAALRELREEAGIEGRVVRLLDADSFTSERYGDLLITTFEVEKTGGSERPGDDAMEVGYFCIFDHPPLAFSSNEKALRTYIALHQESWAIQDSFSRLDEAQPAEMLSDALVGLIEQHADQIARLWLEDVQDNPTTASYRRIDPEELRRRGGLALSQFSRWLKGDEASEEIRAFYEELARERRRQGVALHELVSSLTLLKKHLWEFAHAQGMWDRPINIYRVLELSRRVAVFFDRAIYHAARAFES